MGLLYTPSTTLMTKASHIKKAVSCIELGGNSAPSLFLGSRALPVRVSLIVLVFDGTKPDTFRALFSRWLELLLVLFAVNDSTQPYLLIVNTATEKETERAQESMSYEAQLSAMLPERTYLYWHVALNGDLAAFWERVACVLVDHKLYLFCHRNDDITTATAMETQSRSPSRARRCRGLLPCTLL
jgi:hypothetical protein